MKLIFNILAIFLLFLIIGCKKEKSFQSEPPKKSDLVKLHNDTIEVEVPKSWKIGNDTSFIFSALIDPYKKEEQFFLLVNSAQDISLKDYIREDLRQATDAEEEKLAYILQRYYLGDNDYCYIFETYPKNKVGVLSFIREYNGNIYDMSFKTPRDIKDYKSDDPFYYAIFSFKINGKLMFPREVQPATIDIDEL